MIELNNFKRQWSDVSQEVLKCVESVGKSGWWILGNEVKEFESSLATSWGLPHAVGVANGMDAIEIGLRIFGIKPGDKVLTTPLSAFATTLAVVRLGAVPVFVDIDKHGLIDLNLCEKALKAHPDIKFFVPVHLFGHALDLNSLKYLKDKFGLVVIEDCAQSILAEFNGRPVGTAGDIAATSFYPTKNLGAMGDGGAMLCSDKELAIKAFELRNYGQKEKYVHTSIGLNSRLDELHAMILNRVFLPRLKKWTHRRGEIAARYVEKINNKRVTVCSHADKSKSAWHLFPILVDKDREQFQSYLKTAGVESGVHYPKLIPDQPALKGMAMSIEGSLATAQKFAALEVSLPINPYLTNEEIDSVIEKVNAWH